MHCQQNQNPSRRWNTTPPCQGSSNTALLVTCFLKIKKWIHDIIKKEHDKFRKRTTCHGKSFVKGEIKGFDGIPILWCSTNVRGVVPPRHLSRRAVASCRRVVARRVVSCHRPSRRTVARRIVPSRRLLRLAVASCRRPSRRRNSSCHVNSLTMGTTDDGTTRRHYATHIFRL